jgi:hypothetical protein
MLRPSATSLPYSGPSIGNPPSILKPPEVLTEAELAAAEAELKALQRHAFEIVRPEPG